MHPGKRVVAVAAAVVMAAALASCQPPEKVTDPVRRAGWPQVCDGIVYGLAQIGNRVYVAGNFQTIGTNCADSSTVVTRPYIFAVDTTTGALDTGFNPAPGKQVRALAVTPDGKLIAGGRSTVWAGRAVGQVAKLDPATGVPNTSFQPRPGFGEIENVAISDGRLFVAGEFSEVNGTPHQWLAAFDLATGAYQDNLKPTITNTTGAPTYIRHVSAGGGRVYLAGEFDRVNGQVRTGVASFDAVTGELTDWNPDTRARSWSVALSPDAQTAYIGTADGIYGTCDGEHEAVIAVPTMVSGRPDRIWTTDIAPSCNWHTGDVNIVLATADTVYFGGHVDHLGLGGSVLRSGLAALRRSDGHLLPFGPKFNFLPYGVRALGVGASGLLVGGDFTTVAGQQQQRFGVFPIGADTRHPFRPAAPRVVERRGGELHVSWTGSIDSTDETLVYQLFRDGGTTPIHEVEAPATDALELSFNDTGVTVGTPHTYRVDVLDDNVRRNGFDSAPVTPTGVSMGYRAQVLADQPSFYWQLGEPAGSNTAADATGNGRTGTRRSGGTFGTAGVPQLGPDTALRTDGSTVALSSTAASSSPFRYSLELWVRTTDTTGGKLIGIGDAAVDHSNNVDHHVYVTSTGRLRFGAVQAQARRVVGNNANPPITDNLWHHVVATLGETGMRLYVDGNLVDSRIDTKVPSPFNGYWRLGGDTLAEWPDRPGTNRYIDSRIDEVAQYPRQLTPDVIRAHHRAVVGTGSPVTGTAGLQAHWRLGEATPLGEADDATGGDDGAYVGSPATGVAGLTPYDANTAVDLDGIDDEVSAPDSPSLSPLTGVSVEGWVRPDAVDGDGRTIVSKDGSYLLRIDPTSEGGGLSFFVGTADGLEPRLTAPPLVAGGTYHVVGTYDGATANLYVNGALVATAARTGDLVDTDSPLRIGAGAGLFDGVIDEVAIYDRALTAAEVDGHHSPA